jgi:hypothetical protein
MKIANEFEFNKIMESVDEDLQQNGTAIDFRPIRAVMAVAERLSIKSAIPLISDEAIPNNYEGASLAGHIYKWYESRYGERLKVHLGPGYAAILLKGEAWKINFPKIYGTVNLVCDPDLEKYKNIPKMGINKIPFLNILEGIENLTPAMAKSLTHDDLKGVYEFFLFGMAALQALENISGQSFIKEAKVDLAMAVDSLVSKNPHCGISRWASLQFSEKIIKSLLSSKSVKFPTTHNLEKLADILDADISIKFDRQYLKDVQCSAGVRYGEESVSLEEAMNAHHSSLQILKQIYPESSFTVKA